MEYLKAKIEVTNLRLPTSLLKPRIDQTDELCYMKIFEDDNHKAVHLAEAVASGSEVDRKVYRMRNKEVAKLLGQDDEGAKHIHSVSKATIGILADSETNRHRHSFLDLLGTVEQVRTAEELILDRIQKTYDRLVYPVILMPPTVYLHQMNIPFHKLIRLVGIYGNHVLHTEMETGTWIKVDPIQRAHDGTGWEKVLKIYGPRPNVIKAISSIQAIISEEGQSSEAQNPLEQDFQEESFGRNQQPTEEEKQQKQVEDKGKEKHVEISESEEVKQKQVEEAEHKEITESEEVKQKQVVEAEHKDITELEEGKQKQVEEAEHKEITESEEVKQKQVEDFGHKEITESEEAKQKQVEETENKQITESEEGKQQDVEESENKEITESEEGKQKQVEEAEDKEITELEEGKQKNVEEAEQKEITESEAAKQRDVEEAEQKEITESEAAKQRDVVEEGSKWKLEIEKYVRAKIEEPYLRLPKSLLKPGSDSGGDPFYMEVCSDPTDNLFYMKIFEDDDHKAVHLAEAVAAGAEAERKVYRMRNKEVAKLLGKDDQGAKHIHSVSKATIGILADSETNLHRHSFLDLLGTVEQVKTAEELILERILKTYDMVYPVILMPPTVYHHRINIPFHKVIRLVGIHGNHLVHKEMATGTWIKIDPIERAIDDSGWERPVKIYGPKENVIRARLVIQALISERAESSEAQNPLEQDFQEAEKQGKHYKQGR